MIEGGVVSLVAVIAIFHSNVPEGSSSAPGMKKSGRSCRYIFLLRSSIALTSGIAAVCGYFLFDGFGKEVIAATTAVAAGAHPFDACRHYDT